MSTHSHEIGSQSEHKKAFVTSIQSGSKPREHCITIRSFQAKNRIEYWIVCRETLLRTMTQRTLEHVPTQFQHQLKRAIHLFDEYISIK